MDEDQEERNEILSNMIVIGVSFVVIAAVVVLVMVDVDSPKKTTEHPMNNTGIHMSHDNICGKTDYRGLCQDNLSPVGHKADVVKYFTAAIKATLAAMKIVAHNKPKGGDNQKGELGCFRLIDLGIGQLESVLAVRSEDLFGRKSADVKSSLNSVISYQQKCLQQLPPAKAKPVLLDQALKKPIELARNALCMVHSR
ncbi:putative pectinesterase/pectinesterase inhibitor 13 [Prunus yedoensis var. nudiflora]|uniref:Putative pectinesterase/pectinesterase inhibitor 13 n=1 Tax=Prunus yedoensis var. nudiflora TaxID=2094558 RepID=A0A314XV69_PRUYE|nr:putative pectinesterase/pectinesterase inhibitor 13 [Prunus yedoensis var. nudiflora]